jgi:hypothetical protein
MKTIHFTGQITSLTAKQDGSLGLRIATPELNPTQKAEYMELQGMNLQISLTPMDFPNVPEVKIDKEIGGKTPGQRLRGVLFILFTQSPEGHSEFETYYKAKMTGFIEHLKGKIEE